MKPRNLVIGLLAIVVSMSAWAKSPAVKEDDHIRDRWVVILGAMKDFKEAKAAAQKWSKSTGIPFSMNRMIFDRKGLRFPDNHPDEAFAGEYVSRRYNTSYNGSHDLPEHVSAEKSDDYNGFAKGYYIVVGHIAETAREAEKKTAFFKPHAPTTYSKKARIYMGCMH